jgi:hypothetical protein
MAGPNPIYCPIFPDEVLENVRAEVRRKTASYRSVQRSQLVLLVHEHPDWDQTQLGSEVGLSRRQVQRWRKRWAAGDFSLEDDARPGRTAVFSPSGSHTGQGIGL